MEFSGVDKAAPARVGYIRHAGVSRRRLDIQQLQRGGSPGALVLLGIVTANGGDIRRRPRGFKIEDSYLTPNSTKFSFAALDQIVSSAQAGGTASVTWTGTLLATGAVVSFKSVAAP